MFIHGRLRTIMQLRHGARQPKISLYSYCIALCRWDESIFLNCGMNLFFYLGRLAGWFAGLAALSPLLSWCQFRSRLPNSRRKLSVPGGVGGHAFRWRLHKRIGRSIGPIGPPLALFHYLGALGLLLWEFVLENRLFVEILLCSPANKSILAHLFLPWRAAFMSGVKPKLFLASTSMFLHLLIKQLRQSTWPIDWNNNENWYNDKNYYYGWFYFVPFVFDGRQPLRKYNNVHQTNPIPR